MIVEQATKVKCPLCEGEGEMSPSSVVEQFVNPELRNRLDTRIEQIAEKCNTQDKANKSINFQKEVHTWNPALPIWRRSPKE